MKCLSKRVGSFQMRKIHLSKKALKSGAFKGKYGFNKRFNGLLRTAREAGHGHQTTNKCDQELRETLIIEVKHCRESEDEYPDEDYF